MICCEGLNRDKDNWIFRTKSFLVNRGIFTPQQTVILYHFSNVKFTNNLLAAFYYHLSAYYFKVIGSLRKSWPAIWFRKMQQETYRFSKPWKSTFCSFGHFHRQRLSRATLNCYSILLHTTYHLVLLRAGTKIVRFYKISQHRSSLVSQNLIILRLLAR